MKTTLLLALTALMSLPAWAADLADEVRAAAKKLADKPNYSWSVKVESAQQGQGRGFGAPPSGKTEKDGYTMLTYTMGERTMEAARKGDKVALKSGEAWKSAEELAADTGDGGPNRQRFMTRMVQQVKLPASDAQELAGQVKELKKEGDAYAGALTADAIKQMFTFGGRRPGGDGGGAGGPDTSGLKGTAKFWVKDGVLSKYETRIEGKMTFGQNNREREINRATITEIQEIGSTKIEVPAEAKKKLGA
jgi:hypothetical protein